MAYSMAYSPLSAVPPLPPSVMTTRVFEATLSTHLAALEPKSTIMVDFFFYSQIGKVIGRLCPGTPAAFFAHPTIQSAARAFYNEDTSAHHVHFWTVLSLAIAHHFFPLDRRTPPREPSREAAIARTQKLLLCLLMHPELPTPAALIPHPSRPGAQESEYAHFIRSYWRPFQNNNRHLVQRTHGLVLNTLFPEQAATPAATGPRGCVELIEDKQIDRILQLSLAPFSEMLIDALASLAIFNLSPPGDKESPSPSQRFMAGLEASFRNGFPNDTIHAAMTRATAWRFGIDPIEVRQKLARHLWFAVLNELSGGSSPFLDNIQNTIRLMLEEKRQSHESFLVIHGASSLQHLFKAYRARLKEHLFPRYRHAAIGSSVALGAIAIAYTIMTGIFASTGQTVSMVSRLTPHAVNYDLIICSALLSAAAAAAYAGRHAVGSMDEILIGRQMDVTLRTPVSCGLRLRNSPRAFSASTVLTAVALGLSSQDLFFKLMGGDVNNNLELYSPLAIFLVACLALVLLGPWGMQLLFNAYTRPELPEKDLSAPTAQLLPPRPPGMTYGNSAAVLGIMDLTRQHEWAAEPMVDASALAFMGASSIKDVTVFEVDSK